MIISGVSIISFPSFNTHYNNNIIIDNLTYNSYERYWYIFFNLFSVYILILVYALGHTHIHAHLEQKQECSSLESAFFKYFFF